MLSRVGVTSDPDLDWRINLLDIHRGGTTIINYNTFNLNVAVTLRHYEH
jgi:hypothetical protein